MSLKFIRTNIYFPLLYFIKMMSTLKSMIFRNKRKIKPIVLVRYSIQSKLLAFFISLIIFSLGLTLYFSLDLFYKDKSAYIFETSLSKAESTGQIVSDFFFDKIEDIEIISKFLSQENGREALKLFLQKKIDILDFKIYTKQDNKWNMSSQVFDDLFAPRAEMIDLFKKIDLEISPQLDLVINSRMILFFNFEANFPIVSIAVSDKNQPSVLLLKVSARTLSQFFQATGSPFKSFLVSDRQGYLFAQDSSFSYKEFLEPVLGQKVVQGVLDLKVMDRDFLVAFQKLPSFGLIALNVLNKENAFEVAKTLIFKSLAIGLMIVSIALIAGVFMSHSLTRPIDQLMDATKRVSQGDFHTKVDILSGDEFTVLGRSFNFMCDEINNYMAEIKDKVRMEDELALAQLVQSSFFPHKNVTFGDLRISGIYHSASECGGDWWGIYEVEGRKIVLIGDATGHGVPAALVTATANCCAQMLKDLSQNRPEILQDPALILSIMNRVIYNLGGKILMTFFIGIFDEDSRALTYSNASHNPPYLYRHTEETPSKENLQVLMEANSNRLGHTLDAVYENCRVEFNQSDVLFLYSDGITESENSLGKPFGERRFLKSLLKVVRNDPEQMTSQILEEAYDYYEDVPPNDDITLVIVKRG